MNLRTDAARHPPFFLDGTARKWYNDDGITRKPLNQSAAALSGSFAQLFGLKILKYTKDSYKFQTSIWNTIPRWPLLRFNQSFP